MGFGRRDDQRIGFLGFIGVGVVGSRSFWRGACLRVVHPCGLFSLACWSDRQAALLELALSVLTNASSTP